MATRLLSTQRAINSHLAAVEPPETLVPGVIQSICETLDWSFGGFWEPRAEDGDEALTATAIWHRPSTVLEELAERCRHVRFRRGEGLLGTIWETCEPAWLRDVQDVRLPHSALAAPAGLHGVFGFPLVIEGRFGGVLEFISEERREPEPELVENFQLVGMQLAQYLERWHAQEEQRRLAAIVESSDDAILSKDRNLIIRSWNAGAERLYGYTAEEAIGQPVRMLIPEDRWGEELDILGRVVEGEILRQHETQRLRRDGSRVDVSLTVSPVRESDGSVAGASVIARDIGERLASEAAVAHLAYHDSLTGLANRALLEEHLEIALSRASRDRCEVALLFLDLDNFKMVNDSLGHAAGDRLLVMMAERLARITRGSDVVARHGGDEFLVLLTDLSGESLRIAQAVAAKILAALEEPFTIGAAEFEIGASIGIAIFPRDAETGPGLLRTADTAMYQAKAAGRGRYAVHRLSGSTERDLLSTTARLRRALGQDEFVLHYQPIFTVPDRRLIAVEALLRWNDPSRGLVAPGEFIQLAEDTGLIEPIGEWVIGAICRQALEWREAGLDVRIHFNLSPRQLRQRRAADAIRAAIHAGGVAPGMLTAEITESAAMAEAEGGSSVLNELRQLGIHLSVDDFGAGYSSLGRLRELPVDELKLDRSFLAGVPDDADAGALVRGVIDLANGLGMDTVVEGVETPGQWRFLGEHRNVLAQGFHLARPAAADEVTLMLHEARQTA